MAINWQAFKSSMRNYFENHIAQNESQAAEFIATQYEIAILTGQDASYGNLATIYSKPILQQILETAFKLAKNTNNNKTFSQLLSNGVIGFWTGAQLALLIPPPGSVTVVSNNVVNPGTPQNIILEPNESFDKFIDDLINFFKLHLLTISGITISIVPTQPPAPAPFPWQGYN